MELKKQELEIAGCLRRLTKNRFILRSKNEKWFQSIIDHRLKLQNVFDAFLLHLDVNEALGVIYLRPQSSEVEGIVNYQMGRRQELNAMASLLLFHLRDLRLQFFLNPGSSEVPLVPLSELRLFAQHFSRSDIDRDFERLFRKALADLSELQVLSETSAQTDLYEITSVCELLLPAEQIQETKQKMETYFQGLAALDNGGLNA